MSTQALLSEKTLTADAAPGGSAASGIDRVPLIPIRKRQYGPLVLKRRWRSFVGWAVIFAVSWGLLATDLGSGWKALSLGLMIPGAGFLYGGSIILAALGLLAVPVAVINWFSSGNMSAVLGAWFGGAALSAWYAAGNPDPWSAVAVATPYLTLGLMAFWIVRNRLSFRRGVARAKAHNEAIAAIETPFLKDLPGYQLAPEMSETQLHIARVTFNKALQPVNQWDGFLLDTEQWQMASTRYQVYNMTWGIANFTYSHTPSFTGYARDGMANSILKNMDRRIWGFWRWENLWGNWDNNPDPIKRDNIMITGFIAQQIGLFESLTGDRRFDKKDALVWRWNDKKEFRYNYQDTVDALMNNYGRYDFSWYPCEPGLIYSMCNIGGFTALQLFDRLRGTDNWDRIKERVERSFEEEFMHPDGRAVCLLFERAGLQAPTISSVLGESAGIPGLMAMWPEKAERLWHVVRRQFIDWQPDGSIKLKLVDWGWDTWDATNVYVRPMSYRPIIEMRPTASFLNAAVEMGDTEVVEALSAYIDKTFGPGVSMAITLGRRQGNWRNQIVTGLPDSCRKGPRLAEATYPDVLVARAFSDGNDLQLVLHPGAGGKRIRLGVDQLIPGRNYRALGAVEETVTADPLGCANLVVDLSGRHELRLLPSV